MVRVVGLMRPGVDSGGYEGVGADAGGQIGLHGGEDPLCDSVAEWHVRCDRHQMFGKGDGVLELPRCFGRKLLTLFARVGQRPVEQHERETIIFSSHLFRESN